MKKFRYFIELAYDGSAYHGWQKQPNALGIQEVLEKALCTFFREHIECTGCGRTDTGVHAKQFFIHFDLSIQLNSQKCAQAIHSLNALLPTSIGLKQMIPVHAEAHARFDAIARSYEYHIHFLKNPFKINRSLWLREQLNVAQMNETAKVLLGQHDFSCFSKSHTQTFTNNCDLQKVYFEETTDGLILHITANRFLRNMVRAIVGTLLEVGRNKWDTHDVKTILDSQKRCNAGQSVAACGLYLSAIEYPYL